MLAGTVQKSAVAWRGSDKKNSSHSSANLAKRLLLIISLGLWEPARPSHLIPFPIIVMKSSILAFVLAVSMQTSVSAALVAHWPLDADASDATGNGHNGTVVGSTVAFGDPAAPGLAGSSANFSGNGHIDVPWSAALNPGVQAPDGSGSFTVTLWAYPTAVGGVHRSPFTSREDNGVSVNGPIIYIDPTGNWQYWAGNNGPSGAWNPITAGPAAVNTWAHVAISYDADTTTRKMFLDGVEVINQVGGISANLLRDLHIGSGQDDGNNFFWAGRLDDVGFWNTALSQAEVMQVMTNGVPEPTLPALLGLAASTCLLARRRR
jgi:hypothetical protein